MKVMALTKRILQQIARDRRTMALLIAAPILVLTMLHLVFNGEDYVPKIGLVDLPRSIESQIDDTGAEIHVYSHEEDAMKEISSGELDGYITFVHHSPGITLEGSDPSVNSAAIKWIRSAFEPLQESNPKQEIEISYVHGSSDMGSFDYFGPVLLGFFIFFFVFLIAGVSFIRERTTGTLEKLLSTPIRKWEIIMGYVLGFGLITMIQSTIIAWYSIYVLGMLMEGSFWHVLLITLFLALTALTLGILISSFANNELQMIQFIPVIVVPQIFFSGLFNLETISDWLSWIGPYTPLYYAADALRDVMVRGEGFPAIYLDLLLLLGFSALFLLLNLLVLRKYREI
ncbi:ABC transporter permease [Oceanobacillus piezotolerans]|uniref:ABC transporter permease n=1 Tax=Oceanobacillus piezotolerans TaxID=2448030 RepID=A0A498DJA4_9BACI|nr:ABC transporter permease [Oceanobacillus piezotolerans]RLL42016.1 ABC transporter permease [Oceanobacillus piezotolerans]